ncbi:hypothetical protein L1987_38018 [Smallanthus sonchifolius]|uniref:Uncharacterized protein n=1 Tax=Smallanthus sonchifolius TaxID=185202 RepID=A0ACB9HIP8_9ASTR|nr:hypothetical protein L1987_38018 [Smallanthus sonchifolius]
MQLYRHREKTDPIFTKSKSEFAKGEASTFWNRIGSGPFDPHAQKITRVKHPLYRYLHRCIFLSIGGRKDNTGVVTVRDLLHLRCLIDQHQNLVKIGTLSLEITSRMLWDEYMQVNSTMDPPRLLIGIRLKRAVIDFFACRELLWLVLRVARRTKQSGGLFKTLAWRELLPLDLRVARRS